MFLFLSKVLDILLGPLTWAMLLLLAGLLLARRRARLARVLSGLGVLVLYVFSTELVSEALMRAAEAGVVDTYRPDVTYDAVIVLGGALDPAATERAGRPEYSASVERVLRGFELLREGRARKLLLSGGSLDPRPEAVVEAEVVTKQLQSWDIPADRLISEGKSRNTRENAVESERIIREQGWKTLLLITSAPHMPRAAGCFRAVGVKADTLAVDLRAADRPLHRMTWMPRAGLLNQSTEALRELAGRVVYRWRGWMVE